jgi:hypothetical protein
MFKQSYKSINTLVPKELAHAPKHIKVEVADAIIDALELALTSKINSDPVFAQKLQEIRLLKRLPKEVVV